MKAGSANMTSTYENGNKLILACPISHAVDSGELRSAETEMSVTKKGKQAELNRVSLCIHLAITQLDPLAMILWSHLFDRAGHVDNQIIVA
jgi:hypothetical protein